MEAYTNGQIYTLNKLIVGRGLIISFLRKKNKKVYFEDERNNIQHFYYIYI